MTTPEPSAVPVTVSKRKESLKLIYQPSIHWLGAITVLCILGIAVSAYFPQGAAISGSLATIAGLSAGALAKVLDTPQGQASQPTQE